MHHPFLSREKQAKYFQLLERRAEAWPGPSETRLVETASGVTFMRINGPADAPPLVLLPGGGTNSLMWLPNIGGLSKTYRTYALDSIIDVGRSRNTKPIPTTDALASWLSELFDALGLGNQVNLMGLSHGGWLAANFALRFPQRLRRLVLVAPAAWVAPLPASFALQALAMFLPPRRFWIRRNYLRALPALAAAPGGLEIIEGLTEELATALECFGLRNLTRQLPPTEASDDELARLSVPTLFMVGADETIYDARTVLERLHRVAPSVKTARVEGAGHDLTWLMPETVNRLALDFLR